jgi:hypothetical protein
MKGGAVFSAKARTAMAMTGSNVGPNERDIQDVVRALIGEHGILGALRVAETFAAAGKGEGRAFWLGVAKELRARQG